MAAPDPSTSWVSRSYSCGNWTSTSDANGARRRPAGWGGGRVRALVLVHVIACLLAPPAVSASASASGSASASASAVAVATAVMPGGSGSPQRLLPSALPSRTPRVLAGLGHVARSEDPEARSPHCMELESVSGKSVLLCDPTSIGEARAGESRLCWTFDHTDLCSFDGNITQSNYPGLAALGQYDPAHACDCPAFLTCVHDAAVVASEPGWKNESQLFNLGQCQSDVSAVFGITIFFGVCVLAGCISYRRWRNHQNAKINPLVGIPGGNDLSTGTGSR